MPVADSIRQKILIRFMTDLPLIKIANGYEHDTNSNLIFKKLVDPGQVPFVNAIIGAESRTPATESSTNVYNTETLSYIRVGFQVKKDVADKALLTDEYEKWVKDIKRFIDPDSGITANKYFRIDLLPEDIEIYISSVEPYIDWDNNKGWLDFELTIKFTESY